MPIRAGPRRLLRCRILVRVRRAAGVLRTAGTAVAVAVASHFTEQAFDRSLLDDAYAVSANVEAGERDIQLRLTPREVTSVLFDQSETIYFAVLRQDGSLLAGRAGLQAPLPKEGARYRFSDIEHEGQPLRAVVLDHESPNAFRLVIAQTTLARSALVQRWSQGPEGMKLGQGAGLGLAIVARYAALLDAELRFEKAGDAGGLRVSVAFGTPPAAYQAQARAG